MSPETQAALDGIDVERGSQNVSRILSGAVDISNDILRTQEPPKSPARVSGGKKAAETRRANAAKGQETGACLVGKLSVEQAAHLGKLAVELADAREATLHAKDQLAGAESFELEAQSRWFKYLAEITAK